MYVQMQRIKGNGSDSSGLTSWGTRRLGTCVFAPCCTSGDWLSLCCHRPQPLSCCLHHRCLSLAGVLPGGWSPGRRFGTRSGRTFICPSRGAACGGRKRASSRCPDLALGWDPLARLVPAKGWLCQDSALLPAAPLAPCQPGRRGRGWQGRTGCPRSHGLGARAGVALGAPGPLGLPWPLPSLGW